jgi:multiple sugar transport system ATP-binding protein
VAKVFLDQISRSFTANAAIEAITFAVPDGQFWVMVGPSGCGKSTILRLIAGLDQPSSGQIYIGECLVNQVPARQRDVAMVFQNYALYPHMTVAENLAFGLRLRGLNAERLQAQVQKTAQALNIDHLLDRKPKQLSGGQQQRVALGRAIVRQPQVFLLDEPLSNLDAQLRDETRSELKQLHQQIGITTLYVTHDQVEAMTLADQIVVLNRGRIQQIADPQTLYAQPVNQMVAGFIGNPPMNLLPVHYEADRFWLGQAAIACPSALQARLSHLPQPAAVCLGIRPEHVQIGPSGSGQLVATVGLVEPLGRESLVRVVLQPMAKGAEPLTMQLWATPQQAVRVGDRLSLSLDLEHLYVFDQAHGDSSSGDSASGKNLLL